MEDVPPTLQDLFSPAEQTIKTENVKEEQKENKKTKKEKFYPLSDKYEMNDKYIYTDTAIGSFVSDNKENNINK